MYANILLDVRLAAKQICRTHPTKLTCTTAELSARLATVGCHVDTDGHFNVLDLLRAIRVNVEPVGPPQTDDVSAEERRKVQLIARAWAGGAKP